MWPESFHVAGLMVLHVRRREACTSIWRRINHAFPLGQRIKPEVFVLQGQTSELLKHTSLGKKTVILFVVVG